MSAAQDVRRQLEYGSIWQDRDSVDNYDGLVRALRAADGPERAALAKALFSCLTDGNLLVRSGAVAALSEVADDLGAGPLCTLIEENIGFFRDVPASNGLSVSDLEEGVARSIAKVAKASDSAAIAYLRHAVRRPWGKCLLFRLAAIDGDWLIENAAGLVPKDYFGVLIWMSPERRRRLIDVLRPFDGVPPENFWKQFPEAEAAELKHLLTAR